MALARLATQLRVAALLSAAGDALDDAASAADRSDDNALACWFAMARRGTGKPRRSGGALRVANEILARARAQNVALALADSLSMSSALHATAGELVTRARADGRGGERAREPARATGERRRLLEPGPHLQHRRHGRARRDHPRARPPTPRADRPRTRAPASLTQLTGAAAPAATSDLKPIDPSALQADLPVPVAVTQIPAALEKTARIPQPLVEAQARSRLALARAALGDSREALTLARRAVSLADDVRVVEERVVARVALGHALDADGRSEEGCRSRRRRGEDPQPARARRARRENRAARRQTYVQMVAHMPASRDELALSSPPYAGLEAGGGLELGGATLSGGHDVAGIRLRVAAAITRVADSATRCPIPAPARGRRRGDRPFMAPAAAVTDLIAPFSTRSPGERRTSSANP